MHICMHIYECIRRCHFKRFFSLNSFVFHATSFTENPQIGRYMCSPACTARGGWLGTRDGVHGSDPGVPDRVLVRRNRPSHRRWFRRRNTCVDKCPLSDDAYINNGTRVVMRPMTLMTFGVQRPTVGPCHVIRRKSANIIRPKSGIIHSVPAMHYLPCATVSTNGRVKLSRPLARPWNHVWRCWSSFLWRTPCTQRTVCTSLRA